MLKTWDQEASMQARQLLKMTPLTVPQIVRYGGSSCESMYRLLAGHDTKEWAAKRIIVAIRQAEKLLGNAGKVTSLFFDQKS